MAWLKVVSAQGLKQREQIEKPKVNYHEKICYSLNIEDDPGKPHHFCQRVPG